MAKGQSALEYMMTYGWAILIIVIVAVILYSMGIFNPRASVTASSSGFSPFAVSAAVCGSNGVLSVAFTTGGLPNGATSATIKNMTISSPSGLGSSVKKEAGNINDNVTVASGSTFVANFSSATCTSGTSLSASGVLNYTVSTAAGPATYSATGTIAGTAS
jgi:hypothetical protein